jgi:hypothetical protein
LKHRSPRATQWSRIFSFENVCDTELLSFAIVLNMFNACGQDQ